MQSGRLRDGAVGFSRLPALLEAEGVLCKPSPVTPVAPCLHRFSAYLAHVRGVTPSTQWTYRRFVAPLILGLCEADGPDWSKLTSNYVSNYEIQEVVAPMFLEFLDHLESTRGNRARSRNARLSAIRSFIKYASVRDVENLAIANRVLAIPNKRAARPMITYMTRPEVGAKLSVPNRETWLRSRDHALLLALYNTGARSSEMAGRRAARCRSALRPYSSSKAKAERTERFPCSRRRRESSIVGSRWLRATTGHSRFPPFEAPRSRRMPSTTCCSVPSRRPRRRVLTWPPSE